MDPWIAKATVLLSAVVMVAIRAPHGQRSRGIPVVRSGGGRLEKVLLTFAWMTFFVPLVWVALPAFAFAEYPLRPVPWAAGVACLATGLWIFHRSHADLGRNWSVTLQMREGHTLVTGGIYARIRHPMYLGLLLYSAGQALAVPNWIAGPSYAASMLLIVASRLGPEERMLEETFGEEFRAYRSRTRRLLPGVW